MTAVAYAPRLGVTILRTAARGAVLVGVAIVIGIVLLQVVNDTGPSSGAKASSTANTSAGTTTTTVVGQGRPASQVKVFVQNASGVSGAAATKANVLRGLGYAIVGTGTATQLVTGTVVACKPGFEKERDTLAKPPASGVGTTTGAYPSPIPAAAVSADCIITIGR